jgi:UDP-N-acetylglucosamine 4,6-dehydratase
MDLATALCPDCKTQIIGIRPGEKLHEVMIPMDDSHNTLEFDTYYVIKPAFRYFERRFNNHNGKPVPDRFEYNSNTNDLWLNVDELRKMIHSGQILV